MNALDLAKKLYPALSKLDFIQQTCPDTLQICDKINCAKNKRLLDQLCIECWEREVSQKRADWLIEAKKMCDMIGCQ